MGEGITAVGKAANEEESGPVKTASSPSDEY